MTVTARAKKAYEKYKEIKGKYEKAKSKYDTAKGYYETIKNLVDEDTRSGELFKQGLKGMLKLGGKIVDPDHLTKHPYFTFHKLHLELLEKTLTASSTHENAMKALHSAIASADAAEAMARQLKDLEKRKQNLNSYYIVWLTDGLKLLNSYRSAEGLRQVAPFAAPVLALVTSPMDWDRAREYAGAAQAAVQANFAKAAKQVEDETGGSPDVLKSQMQTGLYAWRANCCDLYFDAAELFTMVEIECRAAAAAYKRYQDKTQKLLKSTTTIDYIAGKAAEKQHMEEVALRAAREGISKTGAVEDPSAHAARQRDAVAAVIPKYATICDVAMSDEAYNNPQAVEEKIGAL